jgi:hypothetical protein
MTKVIANEFVSEISSNLAAKRPLSYNKPSRRQALLEIRRLIVEEGLSHQEIQLRLNIPARTYFNWLDLLFKSEQEAISGNNYTYQRLLNETLILNQRYLRRARMLDKMANDEKIDAQHRIKAHEYAAEFERAAHDMTYLAPSYLRAQGLIPDPKSGYPPTLKMTQITHLPDEGDEYERDRLKAAGEIRRQNIQQQQQQQPNS